METTLNIHVTVLEKITGVAKSLGMSRSDLITALIKKVMEDNSMRARLGRMVRYQRRGRRGDWHAFHLRLREDDYEYLLDLRKLFKMSVSLILAFAVKKYLKKLLGNINRLHTKQMKGAITDNNRFENYVLIREVFNGVVSWRFLWGFPPGIASLI